MDAAKFPRGPVSSVNRAPSGLYPACLRRSLLKMLSMLRASRRGFQGGRYRPPEELDLDSLLVLSASQSRALVVESGGQTEPEDDAERGRLWIMLLMVSLKSLSRLELGLGRERGTCCSFKVSPVREKERT